MKHGSRHGRDECRAALIAPNRYVQGRGILSSLGRYVGELGRDALAIADERVRELLRENVVQSFAVTT